MRYKGRVRYLIPLKTAPLVSVIIPNFNGKEMLRECLRSIQSQTYGNCEVIVVDNNSTDGSPEIVRKEYPWVVLLPTERIGIAQACNRGIKGAKGGIIVTMLNNDMTVDREWLKHLVAALDSRDVGIVGGKIYNYGTKVIQAAGNWIDWHVGICGQIGNGQTDTGQYDDFREVDYVDVPTVRRDVLNVIGGIDEGFSFYYTDVDFCVRAKQAGYKVLYVPAAVMWHRLAATAGIPFWRKTFSLESDGMRFLIKHSPAPVIFYRLCRRMLFGMIRLVRSLLFEKSMDLVGIETLAFLWSIVSLPKAMRSLRTEKTSTT
jgi:GT2 family glycosyltransferase